MWVRVAMAALAAAGLCSVAAQSPAVKSSAAQDRPDCGSLVIVKCERARGRLKRNVRAARPRGASRLVAAATRSMSWTR